MMNTLDLLDDCLIGRAPAGRPEWGRVLVPVSSHAVAETRRAACSLESQPQRWQGTLETTHRTSRRYERTLRACLTSSFRAFCRRCLPSL